MTDLHFDYETRSRVDLCRGVHKYAAHPSTQILMCSWAFDDEPVQLWQPRIDVLPPARLVDGLRDPSVVKKAFNAPFERLITYYKLGVNVPYEQWRCVMVKAYYLGFAGRLKDILAQIGLQNKQDDGGDLINLFCTPAPKNHKAEWYDWSNRPEKWERFCGYCIRDTVVERDLDHWLDRYPSMPSWDWEQYFADQRINDRGVPVDVEFARDAVSIWNEERVRLTDEIKMLTGLPNVSREHILSCVNSSGRFPPFTCLEKKYVKSRRTHDVLPDYTAKVLDLWAAKEAKAATKYQAVLNGAGPDSRARGMFQYKGASRTDRAAGRRLQFQNLKHPVVKKPEKIAAFKDAIVRRDRTTLTNDYNVSIGEALGGAVRHVVKAPEGYMLAVADLTSIESVVLGYVAQCPRIDQIFRRGQDSYRVFGTQYYNANYDDITPEQRSFCKPPVLGCGYMLGWRGLIAYAEGMGVIMTQEQAERAVKTFRDMYPEIVAFWRWIDDAVKYVTRTGSRLSGYGLVVERDAHFLRIRLPSGRYLSYFEPEVLMHPAPWDNDQLIENFSYMGMNQDSHQWTRLFVHAGSLTENIVQSIAGDLLWQGIMRAMHRSIDVVLHVHDEIAAQCRSKYAEWTLDALIHCLTDRTPWAPDLWLGAAGYVSREFTKD